MKTTKLKRDNTYYSLDGVFYGKARLVHAIMAKLSKKYSFYELNEIFNTDFESSYDIINDVYAAKKLSFNYKRYFIENNEILTDKIGHRFCVCNQIGIGNINPIINIARNMFELKIKKIKVKP